MVKLRRRHRAQPLPRQTSAARRTHCNGLEAPEGDGPNYAAGVQQKWRRRGRSSLVDDEAPRGGLMTAARDTDDAKYD